MSDITFKDEPFNRLRFADLRNESEEMKWKILEYHNQPWVLAHIYGPAFTEEQHVKFLQALPTMKRKHYIVYFDGYPIGKYSFDVSSDAVENPGNYLFYEQDTMTGLGALMQYAFMKYVFEDLGVKYLRYSVRKDNSNNNAKSENNRGVRIIGEDDEQYFYESDAESTAAIRGKYEKGLKILFSDFVYRNTWFRR